MSRRKQARPIRVLEPEDGTLQPGGTAEPAGEYTLLALLPFLVEILVIRMILALLGGTLVKSQARTFFLSFVMHSYSEIQCFM